MTASFPFPAWAHRPGLTSGADAAPLEAAKATVPGRFGGPPPADHPAIVYGVALCDAGFHWEAHEVLEAVWIAVPPNGRDRRALRAAIQIANAGLKIRMARPRAARRLLAEADTLLAEVGPGCAAGFADRLDIARIRRELANILSGSADEALEGKLPRLTGSDAEKCIFSDAQSGQAPNPCTIVHQTREGVVRGG